MHVYVFWAKSFTGVPKETDEAIPMWFETTAIPYDEMWEDDRLWIPKMLAGEVFSNRYIFSADRMVDYSQNTGLVAAPHQY